MTTYRLKLKLLKDGIKESRCENCNREDWEGVKIPLELHHVDGNTLNNDICNIQLLCPNCHALTDTYRGKNKKRVKKKNVTDGEIINAITESYTKRQALLLLGLAGYGGSYERINRVMKDNNVSLKYYPRREQSLKHIESINKKYGSFDEMIRRKINWPDAKILEDMLKNYPVVQIAKKLGVSDSAVRKTAKRYGINVKQISKWSQKHG